MNMKKLIAAAVLGLFVVPAFAAAYTYSPDDYSGVRETLVEGHTVFAVIQATLCVDNLGDKGEGYDNESAVKCPDGSTDFDVSWDVRANVTVQRMGTAVAVLVRDRVKEYNELPSPQCSTNRDVVASVLYENPGVLWFNDQFLVGDDLDLIEAEVDANVDVCNKKVAVQTVYPNDWRYPCGGWVFATQAGNPDPRDYMGYWTYEESYRIVDPNDYVWVIHKYGILPTPVGAAIPYQDTAADLGLDTDDGTGSTYDGDDAADGDLRLISGSANADYGAQSGYYLGYYNMWSVPVLGMGNATYTPEGGLDGGPTSSDDCDPYMDNANHETPAGLAYHDGHDDAPVRLYNAVLFFFFEDLVKGSAYGNGARGLTGSPVKVHGTGAPDDKDATGCEEGTEWDCGSYYDPVLNQTFDRTEDDEGNSHPFNPNDDPDSSGAKHVHPTAGVDLYFSNEAPPEPATVKWAVYDTVGKAAPYHAHSDSETFDDRLRIDPCADLDEHTYEYDYVYNGGDYGEEGEYSGTSNETHDEHLRYGEGEYDGYQSGEESTSDCTGYYGGGQTGYYPEYY